MLSTYNQWKKPLMICSLFVAKMEEHWHDTIPRYQYGYREDRSISQPQSQGLRQRFLSHGFARDGYAYGNQKGASFRRQGGINHL